MTRRDVDLLTDSHDIEAAADHLGLPPGEAASITGFAVIVADGDYSHAWATESSRPFDRQTLFEPLVVRGRRIDPDNRIAITVEQIEAGGDGVGRGEPRIVLGEDVESVHGDVVSIAGDRSSMTMRPAGKAFNETVEVLPPPGDTIPASVRSGRQGTLEVGEDGVGVSWTLDQRQRRHRRQRDQGIEL